MNEPLDRGERDAALASAGPLEEVRELALGCRACELWRRATQTVFGEGPAGARLLVVEMVVPESNDEPSLARLDDINMLAITGGRERTEQEFADLFDAAGFDLVKVHKTEVPFCIIEGVRR